MSQDTSTAATLAPIPASELAILAASVYRSTMRLYDATQNIHAQMAQTPATYTDKYQALKRQATALLITAREQSQLHTDLSDLMFGRA